LSFVKGSCLADIGTDHGHLVIAACMEGITEKAIACDISHGPLSKAEENIKRYDLGQQIVTRLGFGLQPVLPDEADCIVIAGMGGMRIIDILKESPDITKKIKRLIVQPQHDIPAVRQTLHSMGFGIVDEAMVQEGERFYNIIAAEPQENIFPYTETEYLLGKCLLDRRDKILLAYTERELQRIEKYKSQAVSADFIFKEEALRSVLFLMSKPEK